MKALRPILFFAAILLVIGLACSAVSRGNSPAQPEATAIQVEPTVSNPPTTAPEPTTLPPTEAATEAPTTTEAVAQAQDFYTEEFEGDYNADDWESFTLGQGEDTNLVIEQEDDHLLFDLGDEDLYVYYMYTPYTYDNVSVKLNAENRGRNNNNVSLVCRMNDKGTQWYEFSVESGGVWYLYAVDGKYNIIDNGGTNALKQGKELNEYQMVCNDNEITLYINGTKIKSIKDNTYGFNEGMVGFNISSLNVLPITVEVKSFEIAQP